MRLGSPVRWLLAPSAACWCWLCVFGGLLTSTWGTTCEHTTPPTYLLRRASLVLPMNLHPDSLCHRCRAVCCLPSFQLMGRFESGRPRALRVCSGRQPRAVAHSNTNSPS
eukprot:m.869781 g.869781  ORF g.869781 m.869781 type:complete len:110 (+) comp59745_c0_seq1:2512-2841(+)